MSVLMIVGRNEPLYEADFGSLNSTSGGSGSSSNATGGASARTSGGGGGGEESAHLNQFIVHSSLDMVERKQWSTPAT